MGEHYSAEQWVCDGVQRESKLNAAEFCDRISVSLNSFYRWCQKLAAKGRPPAKKGHGPQRLSDMKRSMSASPKLVPLTVLTSPVVEIDLPWEAVVRVPNEDRSLRRVLGILLETRETKV